jgi:hypothetical protein
MPLIYTSEKFDSCLNTFRETFSNPDNIPSSEGDEQQYDASIVIPLDFSLEMDGISGIIPNSAFEVPANILPKMYLTKKNESKIAFILHTIDHNFNNNKWTTKITGQTLLIRFDPLSAEEIAARKARQESPSTLKKIIESYSSGRGGTTRNIKGIAYKNGELPPDKLRPILNEAKYNFPAVNKSDGGRVRLFTEASLSLDKLLAAATHANIKLRINSAYRTYADQARVFRTNCSNDIGTGRCTRRKGKNLTAIPGSSNHGFGLAVDFANNGGKQLNESMPEYKWVAENAPKFGFKRIASEAWHWEYQTN